MTNGPSVEAVALASKAYADAPCGEDAGEWHDWVNATARAVDAHTEALRTRLAECEEALTMLKGAATRVVLASPGRSGGAVYMVSKDNFAALKAALKEPSRGN